MKLKIALILFGALLGFGALELCLKFLVHPKKGVEFSSVGDFRKQMLDDEAVAAAKRPDGVPFAAIINPNPDDRIIYELRPNLDVRFDWVNVKTNSCGMRGPERPLIKPPNTYRVALLGDSFAFGWGVEQRESFAQLMEDYLNRLTGGNPKVEVLNFGVPGYSTFQEVALFEEKGLQFDPDAVLVFFIHNDFDFPFFVRDNSSPDGVVESFKQTENIGMPTPPKLRPSAVLNELSKVSRSRGIKLFLTINPRAHWEECWKRLSHGIARDKIDYIDLVPDFERDIKLNKYAESQLNLPNDLHPSALRSKIYGEILTPPLWAEIERSRNEFAAP